MWSNMFHLNWPLKIKCIGSEHLNRLSNKSLSTRLGCVWFYYLPPASAFSSLSHFFAFSFHPFLSPPALSIIVSLLLSLDAIPQSQAWGQQSVIEITCFSSFPSFGTLALHTHWITLSLLKQDNINCVLSPRRLSIYIYFPLISLQVSFQPVLGVLYCFWRNTVVLIFQRIFGHLKPRLLFIYHLSKRCSAICQFIVSFNHIMWPLVYSKKKKRSVPYYKHCNLATKLIFTLRFSH